MSFRSVLTIAEKDIIDALRNARLVLIVLMPIGFSLLYGYLFRDTQESLEIVVYAPEKTAFVEQLSDQNFLTVHRALSEKAVSAKVREEKAALGVVLPTGFDLALKNGARPTVGLILDAQNQNAARAKQVILQTLDAISGRPPVVRIVERSLTPLAGSQSSESREAFLEGLSLQKYFVVLWVMMGITMNGAFLVPTLLVEEKDKKTLDALLVAPVSHADVVLGKLLVGIAYSLLTALIVLSLNQGFEGDVDFTVAIVLVSSFAMTLIGLLIGGLIDSLSTLNTWGGFVLLPLMLPGMLSAIPLGQIGEVLSALFGLVPTYHLVQGLGMSLNGKGVQAWGNLLILAGESVVLFAAILWTLRKREK
jgi:ABC-2 type transport system permease protein